MTITHTHPITIGGSFASDHCKDFDFITFWVSSPKIVASHLIKCFGFLPYAHTGLETGNKSLTAQAIKNGKVIFLLAGAVRPLNGKSSTANKIHQHISLHGDAVKDVAFQVDDINRAIDIARKGGAEIIMEPTSFNDNFGLIWMAKVNGLNDVTHTFVDRSMYQGFLPGFVFEEDWQYEMPILNLEAIDHCVQNEDWHNMEKACEYYKNAFNFDKFWSVDDTQVYTEYSALKSTVMTSGNKKIKMPINEPALGLKKSQIEEFIEFNHGPGIQHIAIRTSNIIDSVKKMRALGVDFIEVPDKYYQNLNERLKVEKHPEIVETLKTIKKLGILVDFDEHGYLLQLFTRPIFDRPTFFFEIIQRHNHDGFGAGNFKGLFEVLEKDQEKRGNLTRQSLGTAGEFVRDEQVANSVVDQII
ncbi:hypothetical protein DAMA08_016590 [Martiniozyma asiatica (nom. inval.)]|nr:hypothetical protein DAMA08_016590 [Martiniozyma asiatica]